MIMIMIMIMIIISNQWFIKLHVFYIPERHVYKKWNIKKYTISWLRLGKIIL